MTLPFVLVGDDLVVTMQGVVLGFIAKPIDFLVEDGEYGAGMPMSTYCVIQPGCAGPICDEDWMFSNTAHAHSVIHRLDEAFGVSDKVRHYWQQQQRHLYYTETFGA